MRLNVSRNAAQERIFCCLNEGYALSREIRGEYSQLQAQGTYVRDSHFPLIQHRLLSWVEATAQELRQTFPSLLEANMFAQPFSVPSMSYSGMHEEVGHLLEARIPTYLARLHNVLDRHLALYADLPIEERLYVEDIDSFAKVRDVNPSVVSGALIKGRLELSEDSVQTALESILQVPFHRADWGGEINDLYTANVVVHGRRVPTAFLLKGKGLRATEMQLSDCGKNGDQVVRLFQSPAELFVVQYVGPIADLVIDDVRSKARLRRAEGRSAHFLIVDGQDTARLLKAYGHMH